MGAMHEIWAALGIEATEDVVAIKRAYAARLRVTRPDDDAQAYQQLRQAYDLALMHVRRTQAEPEQTAADDTPVPLVVPQPVVKQEAVPAAAVVPVDTPPLAVAQDEPAPAAEAAPEWIAPGDLARQVYQVWQEQGSDALIGSWPVLAAWLDAVPLALRDESLRWFAELVLQHPDLPAEFVLLLSRHFEWRHDFRIERVLGPERAAALHERLSEDLIVPIRDPEVLADYADVLTLQRLLQAPRALRGPFKAWLFAALAAPGRLARRLAHTPPRMQRALGIDLPQQAPLAHTVSQAQRIQWALMLALLSLIPMAPAVEPVPWFVRALALGIVPLIGMALLAAAGEVLAGLQGHSGMKARWAWFERQRDAPRTLAVGVGAFASALGAAWAGHHGWGDASSELVRVGWPLFCLLGLVVGAVASWPRGRDWEFAMLPVLALAALAVWHVQADDASVLVALSGAALWLALCNALLVHRPAVVVTLYRKPWLAFSGFTGWRWLWLVVAFKFVAAVTAIVLVLTLPLTLLVVAHLLGWVFTWTGVVAAATLALTGYLPNQALLLPVAAASALALAAVQRGTARLSQAAWFRQ